MLKSEVKFIDIAIFTLWQTFFLQMLYVSWPKMILDMPVSRIITMVTLILYLLAGFNCSVSATLVLLFRKKFLHMVQLVEEADFLCSKYFYEIQHSKHHLVCVALLLGSFVCQGLLILNDYTAGKMLVNSTLSLQNMPMQAITSYYYIIRSIHISCVVAFISGLYSFRDRFFAFNKQLRICFVEKHSGEQTVSYRVMMNHIQGFTAIYSNLCDAIGIFCTIFAWQPMMFCASLIVTVVFSILTIGHMLTNPAPIVLALALMYSALTILYTLLFLVLVKLGSDLKREGKQTAVLVHKAINQSSKTPALVERIVSALATYSVILIQFELGVPKFFISAILQQNGDMTTTYPQP